MSALSDKLKALGVQIGARDLPPPRPRRPFPIEQVVPGRFEETQHGDAFCAETRYPLDHQQGCATLAITSPLTVVAEWAKEPRLAQAGLDTFAFLDTETTGLGGGTGTYVFLVGVGRYVGDSFLLAQFFMRDPAEELAMLEALTRFLEPCRALVTFNGKAFDAPLLATRYVVTRTVARSQESPLASLAHLDLLPLARRLWRDRLASRSLGSLEEHILGIPRTHEDVPGWMIPDLYFEYLRSGDARPLQSVFYHNAMDVVSMVALLNHIGGILEDPFDNPDVHKLDLVAMAKLFEDLGRPGTAVRLYRSGLEHDLPEDLYWRAVQRLSQSHKRRGELAQAVDLWREAALGGEMYAYVELAKHYEHRECDYGEAVRWTQAAIDHVSAPEVPIEEHERWLPGLEHRLGRLLRKQRSTR